MDQDKKAQIDAIWEKLSAKKPAASPNVGPKNKQEELVTKIKPSKAPASSATPEWMVSLGLARPKSSTPVQVTKAESRAQDNEAKEDSKKIAAAALAAAKEALNAVKAGKIEVSEVLDFAGEEVKVTKFLDPNSKAAEALKRKQEMQAWASTGLDKLLQQIDKRPKLNVLEKSRKDWIDFKEEKQLEEELDSYKKSGDKYTDRVAFLQRSELREYEQERDARLAMQAKRQNDISYTEDMG